MMRERGEKKGGDDEKKRKEIRNHKKRVVNTSKEITTGNGFHLLFSRET